VRGFATQLANQSFRDQLEAGIEFQMTYSTVCARRSSKTPKDGETLTQPIAARSPRNSPGRQGINSVEVPP
jgi:hypothetical protein